MTQQTLADLSGMSRPAIGRLESGKADNPKLETILVLAAALGVRPGELFDDIQSPDVDQVLREFEASPWAAVVALSPAERIWLARELTSSTWMNLKPTPDAVADIVNGMRKSSKK